MYMDVGMNAINSVVLIVWKDVRQAYTLHVCMSAQFLCEYKDYD